MTVEELVREFFTVKNVLALVIISALVPSVFYVGGLLTLRVDEFLRKRNGKES